MLTTGTIDYNNLSMNTSINSGMITTDWYGWWPNNYYTYSIHKSSFEIAFKLVSKLIEKKIIKELTLGQFIKLVNEVQEMV